MSWLLLFLEMDLSLFKMIKILFYVCMIILSSALANFIQVINLFIMFFFFHMENWVGIYVYFWKKLKQVTIQKIKSLLKICNMPTVYMIVHQLNQKCYYIEKVDSISSILQMHEHQLNKIISTGFGIIRNLSIQICIKDWLMQWPMQKDWKTLASVLSYHCHILEVHVECISCIKTLWQFVELCRNQISFLQWQ